MNSLKTAVIFSNCYFLPENPWESLPSKKKEGTWAEEQGLRVGDQLLAIGGASIKEHLRRTNGSTLEPLTLMGPQRIMVQLQAAQEDVKMAKKTWKVLRLMDVVQEVVDLVEVWIFLRDIDGGG